MEKPYKSAVYKIVNRDVMPPTVTLAFGREHKTEGAARKFAKSQVDGCLRNGPSNIAEITGPDGFREVWLADSAYSMRGSIISARIRPVQFTGDFVVVDAPTAPTNQPISVSQ